MRFADNVCMVECCSGDFRAEVEDNPFERREGMKLDNLRTYGRTFAVADTGMFFSEWSNSFVHGSDSLLFVSGLAEQLLSDGESIIGLSLVSFRKPMRENLKLAAYDMSQFDDKMQDSADYSLEVVLDTSDGRKIVVFGLADPENPITVSSLKNPFAKGTICPCSNCLKVGSKGMACFKLSRPFVASCFTVFDESVPVKMATLVEILTMALSSRGGDYVEDDTDYALALLAGIRDLPLPDDMREIFDRKAELHLQILPAKSETGRSGMRLLPFRFKFPHQREFSKGLAALTT